MAKDLGVGVLSFSEPQNSRQIDLGQRGDSVEYPEFGLELGCLLCLVLGFAGGGGLEAVMQRSRVATRCPGVRETPQGEEGRSRG